MDRDSMTLTQHHLPLSFKTRSRRRGPIYVCCKHSYKIANKFFLNIHVATSSRSFMQHVHMHRSSLVACVSTCTLNSCIHVELTRLSPCHSQTYELDAQELENMLHPGNLYSCEMMFAHWILERHTTTMQCNNVSAF